VQSPYNDKIKQRIDWEQNGGAQYKVLLAEREAKKQHEISSLKQNCLSSLQSQMDHKEHLKQMKLREMEQEKQIADMKELQLKEEDKVKKEEAKSRQQLYNQALTYQTNMQELSRHNYGKMTFTEKRLNKDELLHFKDRNPDVRTLIPGLNNSQGGAHLVRTGRRQFIQEPGRLAMSLNNPLAPQANEAATQQTTRQSLADVVSLKSQANIMHHPVKDKIYEKRMVEQTNYNTITNPMNGYNRNPYLNKVVSAANLHS